MKIRLFILFLWLFAGSVCRVQSQDSINATIATANKFKITAFPVAFYLPETGFGFGGLSVATFRFKSELAATRPSTIQFGMTYTTKNQFLLLLPLSFMQMKSVGVSLAS